MSKPYVTQTLAELYLRQRYFEVARDAFYQLKLKEPESEEVVRGLAASQKGLNGEKRAKLQKLLGIWSDLR